MRSPIAVFLLLLLACGAPDERGPITGATPSEPRLYTLVPFGHTGYDNRSLADLFVRLTFETEWGGERAQLARLEQPIVVGLEGDAAEIHRPFLTDYLAYLRDNAGLEIREGQVGRNLTVRLVEGRRFRRLLPAASCVLVPGDIRWRAFAKAPDVLGGMAMVSASRLEAVTVFVPDDAIPADVRRCLLEEIAQGLGPLNDLYGLGPSIFNDDFGHLWPTRLDLLMLRVLYSPDMQTGLGPRETERRALAVLDRINPAGRRARPLPGVTHRAEHEWRKRIAGALRRDRSQTQRTQSAESALLLAEAALPGTSWHCHSLLTLARTETLGDPERAERHLDQAEQICGRIHGPDDPRLAQLRLSRAGIALALARPKDALVLSEGLAPVLAGHGLEEALAAYYELRTRALESLGRRGEARPEAEKAAAWRAYAMGGS